MAMIYAKTRHKEISEAYSARLKALDEIGRPRPLQSSLAGNPAMTSMSGSVSSSQPTSPGASTPPPSQPAQDAGPRLSPFEQYMESRGKPIAPVSSATTQATPAAGTTQSVPVTNHVQQSVPATNPRWIQIEKNMQSHNMSEWRVAILEADILLFDMLSQMGYEGNSIGEILKNVDKANFVTLDDAWKAHRIRNIIAHEGANYELSRDEAERTIRLFKRVFDEFYFV